MLRALNWRRALGGGETRPQVFECSDDREWVLKLPGNPHGVSGLCADWVGTALASRADVSVVECDLVDVSETALLTMGDSTARGWAQPGMAFGSLYMTDSTDVLGLHSILETSTSGQRARIIATDTWLDVLDRKRPQGQWNLLVLTGERGRRLVTIDYGMALRALLGPPPLGPAPITARFPNEWRPYVELADLEDAVTIINAMSSSDLTAVAQSIPMSWRAREPRWPELPGYLDARRKQLLPCLVKGGGYDNQPSG